MISLFYKKKIKNLTKGMQEIVSEIAILNEIYKIIPSFKDKVEQAEIREVPLVNISTHNVYRKTVDQSRLNRLMDSMKSDGLYYEIFLDEDNELIIGYLRYLSAKGLNWSHIRAKIIYNLTRLEKLVIQVNENGRRTGFTPAENAKIIFDLKQEFDQEYKKVSKTNSLFDKEETQQNDAPEKVIVDDTEKDQDNFSQEKDKDTSDHLKKETTKRPKTTKLIGDVMGMSQREVQNYVQVEKAIQNGIIDPETVTKFEEGKKTFLQMITDVRNAKKTNKEQKNDKKTSDEELNIHGKCKNAVVRSCPNCNKLTVFCKKKELFKKYLDKGCDEFL